MLLHLCPLIYKNLHINVKRTEIKWLFNIKCILRSGEDKDIEIAFGLSSKW